MDSLLRSAHLATHALHTENHADVVPLRPSQILRLDAGPIPLNLRLRPIVGPVELGPPAEERPMGTFNPSIVEAPDGLCPRCKWVVAVRVDPLHQCNRSSPLYGREVLKMSSAIAWFKGTAILVLDAQMRTIGTHTWLINSPLQQVRPRSKQPSLNTSYFSVGRGSAGDFAPPWAFPVFDVRLFRVGNALFATCVCLRCYFGVYLLQLTGEVTADGGLARLRAWVSQKATTRPGTKTWAQGRNQAVFTWRRSSLHPEEVMAQPWLGGSTASFGAPLVERKEVVCHRPGPGTRRLRVRGIQSCGTTPPQQVVKLHRIRNLMGKEHKRLRRSGELDCASGSASASTLCRDTSGDPLSNKSVDTFAAGFGDLKMQWNSSLFKGGGKTAPSSDLHVAGGHRVSSTTHLVRFTPPDGPGKGTVCRDDSCAPRCEVLLGVGHLHRASGECKSKTMCGVEGLRRNVSTFRWGSLYTHFLYALEAIPPFRLLATSAEFCIGAPGNDATADCESIQFVSGLALRRNGNFVLTYGVNDCEARIGELSGARAWEMLRPVADSVREEFGGQCMHGRKV